MLNHLPAGDCTLPGRRYSSLIMELLVDTWNVLHQTGVLPPDLAGMGVRELSELLSIGRWRNDNIALICDGAPPSDTLASPSRNIQIFYTGGHRSADQEIMDRVAHSTSANRIVVVTNDREIVRSIRARGAQQLGSVAFLEAIVDDHQRPARIPTRKPSGLSPDKAAIWRKEFDLDHSEVENLQHEVEAGAKEAAEEQPAHRIETPKRVQGNKTPLPHTSKEELPDNLIDEARKLAEE